MSLRSALVSLLNSVFRKTTDYERQIAVMFQVNSQVRNRETGKQYRVIASAFNVVMFIDHAGHELVVDFMWSNGSINERQVETWEPM